MQMRKLISLLIILSVIGVVSADTLYEQEGTVDDGPSAIDASGQGPVTNPNSTNWKYQYGGGTWSAVYGGSDGWVEETSTGDMTLDVEADVELYMYQEVSDNKIYFHLGNVINASLDDKTAYVNGSMYYNNGMYIGISFDGSNKDAANMEKDGSGNYTGRIIDALQSDNDSWRAQDNQMDLEIALSWGAGWRTPVAYGDGSHSTIHDTLWWLVDGGNPGAYNYQWRIRLLPDTYQPDGDYYWDPAVVATPVL
jgi:hypothetical protein